MRTHETPLVLTAILAVAIAGCAVHRSSPNRAPSALEPVYSDGTSSAPPPVVVPPSGYPSSAMSTDDNNRARQGYPGYQNIPMRNSPEPRTAQAQNRVVYPAAPQAEVVARPKKGKHAKKAAFVKRRKAKHHATKWASAKRRRFTKVAVYSPPPSPYTVRLREVEALNRLHHVNQSEIALAEIALAHSPSSSMLAMAQQTKDEHQRLEKRVVATADLLGIKLEDYSPATYEVALKNELLRDTGHFDLYVIMAMSRARADAEHDLTVAHAETLHSSQVAALIDAEKPLLLAHRFVPASYRDEALAREGESDLGK